MFVTLLFFITKRQSIATKNRRVLANDEAENAVRMTMSRTFHLPILFADIASFLFLFFCYIFTVSGHTKRVLKANAF